MFTGLIETVGHVARIEARGRDHRLRIHPGDWPETPAGDLRAGDSIAVSGVCLTAVEPDAEGFWADVSAETLAHTALGECVAGSRVNLERALLPTTRLGGHLVSGHVDGVGEVTARQPDGRSWRFTVHVPDALVRYVAPKGSICVDGVSLTVNEVAGTEFGVNIVPHTLQCTTFDRLAPGSRVNIEVDLIARYLERLLAGEGDRSGLTREILERAGFTRD